MVRKILLLSVVLAGIATACFVQSGSPVQSGEAKEKKASPFASTTIDLGVVVSDLEKSVKFYTEAIGFKEVPGFEVGGEYAKDVGLTTGKGLKVRIMVLGEGETATKLKLIQTGDTDTKKNDNANIYAEFGFRYLTIAVTDTTASIERASKAGVKPIAKTPAPLPKGFPEGLALTILRDPDGNLVELVGPLKK